MHKKATLYFILKILFWHTGVLMMLSVMKLTCLFFLVCTQNKLTKCSGVEKQKKKKKVKSDEVKKKTRPQETTTKSYLVPVSQGRFFFFFIRPSGVRNSSSSSLMDSMRSVTSQVQQPQDDVTGVAAFQLAALLVCFVLWHAGLVRGAALCGRRRS